MLTAEEATARLATLHDPAWREPAARRAAALPRPLREPAKALLSAGPSSTGPDEVAAHRNWRLAAAVTLDELSAGERSQLLSALHPGLGPALARWWTDGQERPYQRGWSRKAFRILGSPQVTRPVRLDELTQLLSLTGPYDADPAWLAIWGGYQLAPRHYSMFGQKPIGDLLASAIDLGGAAGRRDDGGAAGHRPGRAPHRLDGPPRDRRAARRRPAGGLGVHRTAAARRAAPGGTAPVDPRVPRRGAPGRLRPDARRDPRQQAAPLRRRRPRGRRLARPGRQRHAGPAGGTARPRARGLPGGSGAAIGRACRSATRGTSTSPSAPAGRAT